MRDWFDYPSISGLESVFDSAGVDSDSSSDLIMLDFSECEDKYIDKEGAICELL